MEIFDLTYSIVIQEDKEANVSLKPSNSLISHYIATYKTYESESEALLDVTSFIEEMRPILYEQFEVMENVPQDIRDQFIL
jgi:hypothetical protein